MSSGAIPAISEAHSGVQWASDSASRSSPSAWAAMKARSISPSSISVCLQGVDHRHIGPRLEGQMDLRQLGQCSAARVDDDQLAAAQHRLLDARPEDRMGLGRIGPHDQQHVRQLHILEAVGPRPGPQGRAQAKADGEWQTREQLSTELVPIATRANFCIR
jgi:hypothetical protein